jgi:hypothetical protein
MERGKSKWISRVEFEAGDGQWVLGHASNSAKSSSS